MSDFYDIQDVCAVTGCGLPSPSHTLQDGGGKGGLLGICSLVRGYGGLSLCGHSSPNTFPAGLSPLQGHCLALHHLFSCTLLYGTDFTQGPGDRGSGRQ